MHRTMRIALFSFLLAVAAGGSPIPATAAAAAIPRAAGALTLQLVAVEGGGSSAAGADAVIDVGAVSARARSEGKGPILVRRRVGLRLDGPYASARVSVALAVDMPGYAVRVDGRTITVVPTVINAVHRVGVTVVHDIELTIPATVPAGVFLGNLQWLAETD